MLKLARFSMHGIILVYKLDNETEGLGIYGIWLWRLERSEGATKGPRVSKSHRSRWSRYLTNLDYTSPSYRTLPLRSPTNTFNSLIPTLATVFLAELVKGSHLQIVFLCFSLLDDGY